MNLKKLLSLTLFVVILILSVFSVGAADIPDDYDERQQDLESQAADLESNLKENSAAIEEKQAQIDELNSKIDALEKEMDELTLQIDKYTKEIEELENAIESLEEQIEEDYVVLGNRLKEIYMAGEASNLEILLGAKDFDDLVDKINLVGFISEHDQKLIDDLKNKMSEIETQREQVTDKKELLEEDKLDLEQTALEYEGYVKEANAVLEVLKKESDSIAKQLEDNAQEQDDLMSELEEWYRQEALKKQNASVSIGRESYDGGGYQGTGNYTWPAPECTIITAYWGDGRNHQGVDFACNGSAYGKVIVAAESGTVSVANSTDSWGSGWGYYVLIDHGNGLSTRYAHCSLVTVSAGQSVSRGQVIGYIGNTGNSYGAHLHFECLYNGIRYNPMTELA